MIDTLEIFVALLHEGVDVWRPVKALHIQDNVYEIVDQTYERTVETWQFEPGERVVCEQKESDEGPMIAAIASASNRTNNLGESNSE